MKDSVKENVMEIQKEFFIWLKENEVGFPKCCFIASEVLIGYFKPKFPSMKTLVGEKQKSNRIFNVHQWIEVDDIVIDFTRFQYKIKKEKFTEWSNEETYDFCINQLQNGTVFFIKEEYYKDFKPLKEVNPRFVGLSNLDNFKSYLFKIKNEDKFINYSWKDDEELVKMVIQ